MTMEVATYTGWMISAAFACGVLFGMAIYAFIHWATDRDTDMAMSNYMKKLAKPGTVGEFLAVGQNLEIVSCAPERMSLLTGDEFERHCQGCRYSGRALYPTPR
jgi:hypothetical protein